MEKTLAREDIITLLDNIIPGTNGKWPSFSKCISVFEGNFKEIIDKNYDLISFIIESKNISPSFLDSIQLAEALYAGKFQKLYRDMCDLYYSSSYVTESVEDLANAGPREASPHFESQLLTRVIASEAGKRRL